MIGATEICGRWISEDLLGRLSRRSVQANAPSRTEIVEAFCQATHWRDGKGRYCISSARIALGKLEKQGKVILPAKRARSSSGKQRSLFDDGGPLPPLPKLPAQSGEIQGFRLVLIKDSNDPNHYIWNRLICREHPLKDRPLVGAQLRYLIECDQGVIGAFGIGPAAFHMACRDQWIGWSLKARDQNRTQVVGVSRFLIRSGVCCRNLGSFCYGQLFRVLQRDWQERYGIKPVLVETYVDRSTHTGRSLAAANWRRLGESKGRGRDDQKRLHSKTKKDLWVYQLEKDARERLQKHQVEPVVPRSVFCSGLAPKWAAEEMLGVELGDERLNERAQRILECRWQNPTKSFSRSFEEKKQAKGAYQLVESERSEINVQSLLRPHYEQTARRMAAEKVVLLPQDTTPLSYNTLHRTEGLGPIGEDYTRGLLLHTLQAYRLDGIPLGTCWAEIWARPKKKEDRHRNEQSVADKESGRWTRALQGATEWARRMPRTRLLVCGDRESDIYELFEQPRQENVDVLVRSQHDRCLTDGSQLLHTLAETSVGGQMVVKVPRGPGRPARQATLELRWREVEIRPPAVGVKKTWPSLKLYAVMAREVGTPAGVEPIEWVLLTSWPVKSLKMARRMVRWYALRWGIECWHKVLKTVCGVEKRQMKSAETLERALAFDMIVAWRVFLLTRLGKEHPHLPADLFYTDPELEVLKVVEIKKKRIRRQPKQKLTVLEANILVAMLAGFWARKSDGHPGAKVLSEGLMILEALVWYDEMKAKGSSG